MLKKVRKYPRKEKIWSIFILKKINPVSKEKRNSFQIKEIMTHFDLSLYLKKCQSQKRKEIFSKLKKPWRKNGEPRVNCDEYLRGALFVRPFQAILFAKKWNLKVLKWAFKTHARLSISDRNEGKKKGIIRDYAQGVTRGKRFSVPRNKWK